jgi:hypothetical protein
MKIVERIPAHYAVQDLDELGRAYRWCPERAVVECEACGKRTTFKRSSLITSIVNCECGNWNSCLTQRSPAGAQCHTQHRGRVRKPGPLSCSSSPLSFGSTSSRHLLD